MRIRKWRAIALVGILGFTSVAQAQTDVSTKAAAEGLFDQGREAMKKGDFAAACGLLERSQQLDPAVGTLLYLAECYEKSGRTASAWATFRDASAAARAVGQTERARVADERADRLTPQLSRLTIEVSEGARAIQGLTIRRQGQALPAPAWNVPVPLDPGKYRIEASAPGYADWTEVVEVTPGGTTARIAVPALTPQTSSTPDTSAPTPGTAAPAAPDPSMTFDASASVPSSSAGKTQRIAAYALAGLGVAGIGVGSYFGLRAIDKNEDAEGLCPGNRCTDREGMTLTDEANDAATISNIGFGLGLAALAGGVVLYLTAPDSGGESPSVAASVSLSGVALKGAF